MEEKEVSEDRAFSKREVLKLMAYPLLTGLGFNLLMLFLLAKGAKCETMAAAIFATCLIGGFVFLVLPALTIVPMIVLKAMHQVSGFCIVAILIYYAILLPPLAFIPPWQKVVPNVRTAYAEYKAKYPGNGHRQIFADAERWGNLTRPVFDWLAR